MEVGSSTHKATKKHIMGVNKKTTKAQHHKTLSNCSANSSSVKGLGGHHHHTKSFVNMSGVSAVGGDKENNTQSHYIKHLIKM
jgi:hypothetical protein